MVLSQSFADWVLVKGYQLWGLEVGAGSLGIFSLGLASVKALWTINTKP